MTTISKDADLVTVINVFRVDPMSQSRLVELLTKVTDAFVRHARGFLSASLHRSRDGTKVTMYAQWRSLQDYETMRRNLGPVAYLQEALSMAKFEPGIYDVVESFAAPRDET
jgi:quinol monooxygenase YgiN